MSKMDQDVLDELSTPHEIDIDATDEMEVEIVDDPVDSGDKKPIDPEADTMDDSDSFSEDERAKLGSKTRTRIDKLVWARNEERRRREAAERLKEEAILAAAALKRRVDEMQSYVGISSKELTSQVAERAKAGVDLARKQLQDAHESGDTAKIADAQEQLTKAQIFASQPEAVQRKIVSEWQQARRKAEAEAPPRQQAQPTPDVPQPTPRAAQWYQANPWFGKEGNEEMTSTAYGIHENLLRSGVEPDSDAYYARLDRRLREIFPSRFAKQDDTDDDDSVIVDTSTGSQPVRKKPAAVVAPSTRSTGGAPKKVRLSKSQVEIAERLGIPLAEYARQVRNREEGA